VRHLRILSILLPVALCLAVPAAGRQAAPGAQPAPISVIRVTKPPVLDGVLGDEAWAGPPLDLGDWLSYNPLPGDRIAQKTDVWLGYDARYLYVAFRCSDPEPARIKTGIRRRDTLFNDDWVGLSLDSLGTRQTSYDMFVNPSGMQADILTGAGSGENTAPDWVWESAGALTDGGYNVELRVPLESLRFKGGARVAMGILFWRRVSRLGVSVSWPDLPPGRSVFERYATAVFTDLPDRRTREVIPSATYALDQKRENPSRFAGAHGDPQFGASVKFGLSSSATVDATVNPDFSQVESDAFQVEVNQRYPVFYSEKRPFFMEGSDLFSLAGPGGDSNMQAAVHTRRIIDPVLGAKFTASAGKLTFGSISAWDEAPGRTLDPDAPNPYEGQRKAFNVARATYSLGPGSFVGALITDTRFAGGGNTVAGADLSLKLDARQRVSGMLLYTTTRTPDGQTTTHGLGSHAAYSFSSRRTNIQTFVEHYDTDFQMDTAFYNQTGITRGWVYADYNIYPDKTRYPWLRRIVPFVFSQHGRDRIARGNEHLTIPGIRLNLTRQGFLRIDQFFGREPWMGQSFKLDRTRIQGSAQIVRWLNVDARFVIGYSTYYDTVAPFQGKSRQTSLGFSFEPIPRFAQRVSFSLVDFDRASTGERVYNVRIVNTRSVYQFSKHFFVRGIVQFDSQQKRVLTDFIASYELRAGTVLHAGYGSLIEQRGFRDNVWVPLEGDYLTTQRGLFFKASYLYRF
jgi:Domain of unknown function (DUF5916)